MNQHSIAGPAGRLEAVSSKPLNQTDEGCTNAVVIAHPHPLYGGTMDNAVVTATARAANAAGSQTLRFNFRGTGQSQGKHDEGKGEVEDLAAALSWSQQHFRPDSLWLAGYSFGAAMILRSTELPEVAGVLLIAPPLSVYTFDSGPLVRPLASTARRIPVAVVCGADDDFTAAPHRQQLDSLDPILVSEVPNTGHDLGTASGSSAPLDTTLNQAFGALLQHAN